MFYPAYPALEARHVRDARLYADRAHMLRSVQLPAGPVIGEVGVAIGWFSAFLIEHFKPNTFVAFDLFNLHTIPILWGQSTSSLFEGKTHYEFYHDRFFGAATNFIMEE